MSEETLRRDENSERFLRERVLVIKRAVHDLIDDGRTQPINLLRQEVKDRFGALPGRPIVLARFDLSRC